MLGRGDVPHQELRGTRAAIEAQVDDTKTSPESEAKDESSCRALRISVGTSADGVELVLMGLMVYRSYRSQDLEIRYSRTSFGKFLTATV